MILKKKIANWKKDSIKILCLPSKEAFQYLFLLKKGWSVVNITAMPGSMKLFNHLRKGNVNLGFFFL